MRTYTWAISILVILLLFVQQGAAQATDADEYEEVMVYLRVQSIGGFDVNALYHYDNDRLYLPVTELFTFLKINQRASEFNEIISGFFIDESNLYEINHKANHILIGGKTIPLNQDDIIRTETGLYLWTGMFGKAFGLNTSFNFRAMTVDMKTDLELPAIREMRLQQLRKNLEQLRGEIQVDTTVRREYHLFRIGMIDWALSSTQITNKTTDHRFALGVGMELLAGETNIYFNHSTRDGLNLRNQQYQWRFVTNENPFIRQVRVGKIGPGSIASIFDPMHGITISNATTSFRRSFGEYTLADYTEPGWTIELYVNNVLIAYQVADASGYFSFDVPLVYGASQVMLKFYGPYGEERVREQFINIPYNFLPKGEFEYHLTSGLVSDSAHSLFAKGVLYYGVNRFLTIGGGLEHLSSITTGTEIPFGNMSVAPFRNLLISGEYAHGVRTKALLSYRLPTNLVLEIEHATYESEQTAIRYNYLEERKASINIPLRSRFLRGSARLTYKQNVYEMLNYNTADASLSTSFGPVSGHIAAYATWISEKDPYIYSNVSLGIRLKHSMLIRPQIQYDITNKEIVSIKLDFEKRIKQSGHISLSYQDNLLADYRSLEVAFRWDLPFAQVNSAIRVSNFDVTTTQGARGGLAFDDKIPFLHKDSRSSIGRGGITFVPYLDINHNNIKDDNEPLASGLIVKVNGGRMLNKDDDSLIRILELEPYTGYLIELDDASLDNISWKLNTKVIRLHIDPNQFKHLEIPIQPGGEVNGMVSLRSDNRTRGISRVMVNIYKPDSSLVTKVMSESDGFFTYLGLAPGSYYAQVDGEQMQRVGMVATPEKIDFEILPMAIGDIVDGLEFELEKKSTPEPVAIEEQSSTPENQQETATDSDEEKEQTSQTESPAASQQASKEVLKEASQKETEEPSQHQSPETTQQETQKEAGNAPETESPQDTSANQQSIIKEGSEVVHRTSPVDSLNQNATMNLIRDSIPGMADSNVIPGTDSTGSITKPITTIAQSQKATDTIAIKTENQEAFQQQQQTLVDTRAPATDIDTNQTGTPATQTDSLVAVEETGSGIETGQTLKDSILQPQPRITPEKETGTAKTRVAEQPDRAEKEQETTMPDQKTPSVTESFNPLAGHQYVQAGAFRSSVNAAEALKEYERITGKEGALILEQGLYKIRFGQYADPTEAAKIRERLESHGVKTLTGEHVYRENYIESDTIQTLQEALRIGRIAGSQGNVNIVVLPIENRFIVRAGYLPDTASLDRLNTHITKNNLRFTSASGDSPSPVTTAQGDTPVTPSIPAERPTQITTTTGKDTALLFSPGHGPWFVQAGAFVFPANAVKQLRKYTNNIPDLQGIVYENGFFNVRFGYFATEQEAIACQERLKQAGFNSLRGRREHGPHYLEIPTTDTSYKTLYQMRTVSKRYKTLGVLIKDGDQYRIRMGYYSGAESIEMLRRRMGQ